MDGLAETGASWFCTTAHLLASASVEMSACGSQDNRYAVGLATAAVVTILCLFAAWRGTESWR